LPSPVSEFNYIELASNVVGFYNNSLGVYLSSGWDFGDGLTSIENSPVHKYANPGTYTVTLHVSGAYGSSDSTQTIVVVGLAPVVSFSYSTGGMTAKFVDNSTVINRSWTWNFGDGSPVSHEQNPLHAYATAGVYTVTLTTDQGETSQSVSVGASAPALITSFPVTAVSSETIRGLAVDANNIYVGLQQSTNGSIGALKVFNKSTYDYIFDITQEFDSTGGTPDVSVDATDLYILTYNDNLYDDLVSAIVGTHTPTAHAFSSLYNQKALAEDSNYLYVLQDGNILRYTLPANNGGAFVDSNSAPIPLANQYGLAARAGILFLTDIGDDQLWIGSVTSWNTPIDILPRSLTGASNASPFGVDVDDSHIYVAVQGDDGSTGIQVFDLFGNFQYDVVGPGGAAFFGLAVDDTSIYITDSIANNIYIYSKGGGGSAAAALAAFTFSIAGTTVNFTDESEGAPSAWAWQFETVRPQRYRIPIIHTDLPAFIMFG
jgi:PKD repeat protein